MQVARLLIDIISLRIPEALNLIVFFINFEGWNFLVINLTVWHSRAGQIAIACFCMTEKLVIIQIGTIDVRLDDLIERHLAFFPDN